MPALITAPTRTEPREPPTSAAGSMARAEPTREGLARFTVDEYMRMFEVGALSDDRRYELLDGMIYERLTPDPSHAGGVNRLNHLLMRRYGDRAVLSPQNAVKLSDTSLPEPDLALLKPRDDFYSSRHAEPDDILLLIEVSHTTQRKDRGIKLRLYAELGVREYWILDVKARAVEVYRQPGPEGYGFQERLIGEGEIAPLAFPDVPVTLSELLGS